MNIDWTEAWFPIVGERCQVIELPGIYIECEILANRCGDYIYYVPEKHAYGMLAAGAFRPIRTQAKTEPATTAWDGTGFPPVGTICECLFNDGWVKVVVLSVNGDEAWVRRPRGSHIVSKGLGNEFRPIRTQAQREREDAVEKALAMDCHPREGMLRRVGE